MFTFWLPSGGDKLKTEKKGGAKKRQDSEPPIRFAFRNTNTKQAYTKTFERLIQQS